MRIAECLGIVVLAILAGLFVYQGFEKEISSSVSQTADQITSIRF